MAGIGWVTCFGLLKTAKPGRIKYLVSQPVLEHPGPVLIVKTGSNGVRSKIITPFIPGQSWPEPRYLDSWQQKHWLPTGDDQT
jgi:hypothetical protein